MNVPDDSFAVILHPLEPRRDVTRVYPALAGLLPLPVIHLLSRRWPPQLLSELRGIRSKKVTRRVRGWIVACPLTSAQMLGLPPQVVYDKIVQTGRLAQRQGARLIGLGGFSSVVGDGGVTVEQRLGMPVTTGKSLTVGSAVEALTEAANGRETVLAQAQAAVVGASGSVGLACAEMLAPQVDGLVLVGRQEIRLSRARAEVEAAGARTVRVSTSMDMVAEADLVLSATSSPHPVLFPRHLKKGAVVCDVALPGDVSTAVAEERKDVTVVRGGLLKALEPLNLGLDLGLQSGVVYASMAEVMLLALEGRYESFSLGQSVDLAKVSEIRRIANSHGFELSTA